MTSTLAPTISVVVPCYNGGKHLDGLLASLSAQDFRDFETIVVDDGSNDPETLLKLNALPKWVRLVSQKNGGLPAARNAGFAGAQGRFILPLDCDDRIASRFLSKALTAIEPAGRAFVFADMQLTGDIVGVLPRRFNAFDQLFLNRLPYCMLMPREAWTEAGGYDESMRDGYEDWEFNIRLARLRYRGIRLAEPLFIYTVSSNGMLMSRSIKVHGAIWKTIRRKHAQAYRWSSLLSTWRDTAGDRGTLNPASAAALLAAANVLPGEAFSRLIHLGLTAKRRFGTLAGRLSDGASANR